MLSDLKIAVLTDVHGNGYAAEAVARAIWAEQPDLIVNLGDQWWGQANPRLAVDVQPALGAVEVRGNNDERLTAPAEELTVQQRELRGWLVTQLPPHGLQRLAQLPVDVLIADGAVLATHGTPGNPWDSLLLSWDGQTFSARSEQAVVSRLGPSGSLPLILTGHLHHKVQQRSGTSLRVMVGPVAYPNDGDPYARWALAQRQGGKWSVNFRRVRYDWHEAARWTRLHGVQPDEGELHLRPLNRPWIPVRE